MFQSARDLSQIYRLPFETVYREGRVKGFLRVNASDIDFRCDHIACTTTAGVDNVGGMSSPTTLWRYGPMLGPADEAGYDGSKDSQQHVVPSGIHSRIIYGRWRWDGGSQSTSS